MSLHAYKPVCKCMGLRNSPPPPPPFRLHPVTEQGPPDGHDDHNDARVASMIYNEMLDATEIPDETPSSSGGVAGSSRKKTIKRGDTMTLVRMHYDNVAH